MEATTESSYHKRLLLLFALIASLAGLGGVYLRLRREFTAGIALLSVTLIAGATPLVWYTVVEPSPVDLTAFALSAWLAVRAARAEGRARALLWAALIAVPALAVWITLASRSALDLASARWVDVLFSSWHGLLSWSPAVYFAVAGTIAYLQRDAIWAAGALGVLLVSSWLAGAAEIWPTVQTFGGRPLISTLAVLAPGLAFLTDAVRRRPLAAIAPLVVVPIVWNHLLMVQYTVGMLPKDEPVSFARMVRQQADAYTRAWSLYPFAFPANVIFAWREALPIDRYDTLALEPRHSAIDLTMDRAAGRFLLDGWDGSTAAGEPPGWWIGGRAATLALNLALPRDRPARILVTARSRYEEPVVQAELALLVNGHEVGRFSPGAETPSEAVFTVSAARDTPFRKGFNRISFASRGWHRIDPMDTRAAGPLARRSGNPAWPVAIYRIAIGPT